MRILVISNLFPPYHRRGFEMDCQDIVESLKNHGHQIRVLTSTYGLTKPQIDNEIHRSLKLNLGNSTDWKDIFIKELNNQTVFRDNCLAFHPDISFFFNLSYISLSLYSLAEEMNIPSCFYYANNWFVTLEKDHWHQLWPREKGGYRILRYLAHRFELLPPRIPFPDSPSIFAYSYLKNLALEYKTATPDAPVIPCGVDIDRYPFIPQKSQKPGRLLCVEQHHRPDGLDDLLKAMALLKRKYGKNSPTLTIVGEPKREPGRDSYFETSAAKMGIREELTFIDRVPQEKMPHLYQSHDVFISSSYEEDSSNRALLEAMSSGLGIVSTSTVSKSEILEDGATALLYPCGNPDACAEKIHNLLNDRTLLESIQENARKTVAKNYQRSRSMQALERVLENATKKLKPFSPQISSIKKVNLSRLIRRASRWLALGNFAVFIKTILRPKVFLDIPVKIYKKLFGITPHFLYKILFDARFLSGGRRRKKSSFFHQQIKRILVLQLADIGDVVLTSPFLRELRKFFPQAWIGLVVQPRMFDLVDKCPHVDAVFPFDWGPAQKREKYLRGSPRWWIQAFRMAKRNFWKCQPDLAISTRWNEDPCQAASLILMYASGAAHRVAYKGSSKQQMRYGWRDLDRLITEGPFRGNPKHEVEQQLDILRYLGADPSEKGLEVWNSREDERFAEKLLDRYKIGKKDGLVAFAPGAAWPFRRWPAPRFIELGRWLQDIYNVYVLIFAAKNEEELALEIEKGLSKEKTVNLAGRTSLREMAALFKHCKLFIGNDSGPLHIAAAAGVPVIGFYGPGEYYRFKPWGMNHGAIRLDLSCSPCSQNCLFDGPRCIEGITLERVKNLIAQKIPTILDVS